MPRWCSVRCNCRARHDALLRQAGRSPHATGHARGCWCLSNAPRAASASSTGWPTRPELGDKVAFRRAGGFARAGRCLTAASVDRLRHARSGNVVSAGGRRLAQSCKVLPAGMHPASETVHTDGASTLTNLRHSRPLQLWTSSLCAIRTPAYLSAPMTHMFPAPKVNMPVLRRRTQTRRPGIGLRRSSCPWIGSSICLATCKKQNEQNNIAVTQKVGTTAPRARQPRRRPGSLIDDQAVLLSLSIRRSACRRPHAASCRTRCM